MLIKGDPDVIIVLCEVSFSWVYLISVALTISIYFIRPAIVIDYDGKTMNGNCRMINQISVGKCKCKYESRVILKYVFRLRVSVILESCN